jgi:hypothetical protein
MVLVCEPMVSRGTVAIVRNARHSKVREVRLVERVNKGFDLSVPKRSVRAILVYIEHDWAYGTRVLASTKKKHLHSHDETN